MADDPPVESKERESLLARRLFEDGKPVLAALDYAEERRRLARRRRIQAIARSLLAWCERQARRGGQ